MNRDKRRRLEAAGWKVGRGKDFLALPPEEALLIDLRARLALTLVALRGKRKLTQAQLAERIQSSQSRVAKMEAADSSVSLDLLIRSLLALGATRKQLAIAIAGRALSRSATAPPAQPRPRRS